MIQVAQPRWYVVQTHPHAELKASANPSRQGYSVFLPRYLKRRRHARRVETIAAPLFPRYMFVAVAFGVSRLVCIGDEPAAVPVGVVEGLQQRQDMAGFVQLSLPPRFAAGDKVRVLDGVFTACLGLYEKMIESEGVAVLLDLLGRKVRVVLDAVSICAA